jgi:dienelactone hydrolase
MQAVIIFSSMEPSTLPTCHVMRALLLSFLLLGIDRGAVGQTGKSSSPPVQVETAVVPLADEDIDSICRYSITLPQGDEPVRGVWVIFDRGRDVHELSLDPDVAVFARRFNLALLLHGHCPGKTAADHGDMNMTPSQGLGPALLRALDQFARITSHPELSKANLILLGFSGAGPLSARLIGEYPQRVLAGILSAPGHYQPEGIDTVRLNHEAQEVPELIIAGGADNVSGTQLPYGYFEIYRRLGAPWTFVVQNQSPHCCTANTKSLMLEWLSAVLTRRMPDTSGGPLRNIAETGDWLGFIQTQPTRIKDSFGLETFNVSSAEIRRAKPSERLYKETASWLPTASIAQDWLSFIQQDKHPILPLR